MMFKRVCRLLIITIAISLLGLPVLASSDIRINDEVYDKNTAPSSDNHLLVTITRPQGNEYFYASGSYIIRGETDKENIRVMLLKLNDKGVYEPFKNTDGETNWIIGGFGKFSKEVDLSEGANNIRIVAFKDQERDYLQKDINLQINDYIITLLNEKDKDRIKNGTQRVNDLLNGIFGKDTLISGIFR